MVVGDFCIPVVLYLLWYFLTRMVSIKLFSLTERPLVPDNKCCPAVVLVEYAKWFTY